MKTDTRPATAPLAPTAMTTEGAEITDCPHDTWFAKARALDERLAATGEAFGTACT